MNLHRNARLTPRGRLLLVERVCGQQVALREAAAAAGISSRTASKWVARYRREGSAGLNDRSSAPRRIPRRTSEQRVAAIAALRRVRMTAAEISELLGMPLSTVSAVLLRIGLGKRSRLEPLEPSNRYQRERPGELVHIDVKKLGRIKNVGLIGSLQRQLGRDPAWTASTCSGVRPSPVSAATSAPHKPRCDADSRESSVPCQRCVSAA